MSFRPLTLSPNSFNKTPLLFNPFPSLSGTKFLHSRIKGMFSFHCICSLVLFLCILLICENIQYYLSLHLWHFSMTIVPSILFKLLLFTKGMTSSLLLTVVLASFCLSTYHSSNIGFFPRSDYCIFFLDECFIFLRQIPMSCWVMWKFYL